MPERLKQAERDVPGRATSSLGDRIYAEQVRSLFVNATPAAIMLLAFTFTFVLAHGRMPSTALTVVGTLGVVASATRLACTYWLREEALTASLDRQAARRLELIFAVPYTAFSALLGVFGMLVFLGTNAEVHMLVICLIVGYCAGVATNCGQRPLLAISSIVLAVIPVALVSFFSGDSVYVAMALIASAFVIAGAQSVQVRCQGAQAEIGQRLTSTLQARRDTLTRLPNRLALREYFREARSIAPAGTVAVHYLDLDGFKQVNDLHGHGVGDALLAAVAERLRGAIRAGDIVARLGGDEFAVVQFGIGNAEEAERLARRVALAIREPYEIEGLPILISTCVGTIINQDRNVELETLLERADGRLYEAKRQRGAPQLSIVAA